MLIADYTKPTFCFNSVAGAFKNISDSASSFDQIFVFGSFITVAEMLALKVE